MVEPSLAQLNLAELSLGTAALAVLGFSLHLLLLRVKQQPYVSPLLLALMALALIVTGPLIFQLAPGLIFLYIAALPVAFFALPPSLYLYAKALSTRTAWRWQWRDSASYWTQLLAIPLAVLIYTLPEAEQQALFFADSAPLQGQALITAVLFWLATLLWLAISLWYLLRISRRLQRYRQQLRQVFAADSGKRLYWLDGLMAALLLSWGYAVLVLLAGERLASPWLSDTGVLLLALLLVWLLCYCGLQQQPGFAEVFSKADSQATETQKAEEVKPAGADKYQRSALGEAQTERIANKLQQAVYQQQLYLDPALTLYKLAEQLGVSPQYLSQTLNQRLQQSFYDYINEARVAAARQLLQHSQDSVLSIAMAVGFNARSSFYKAFKASTGLTPAQYRAQNQTQAATAMD
ncbi:helix-turn-helix domain-containing protein [Alkalimonas mucilaginosa]|uniref:Helix-turn-helix transcriptional regulator n=1 Tax=Alkalimonas mucilaginosa TaxID=3057676 RepID=A0ABU7JJS9_9GAMM|nr:helix-turn-helix transcriptional regulator [Alkalimonas sp. MEB004]MEE2025954.1 helix-turn-helix transcriptional regulator [Alkalimonas sp. MEB004]